MPKAGQEWEPQGLPRHEGEALNHYSQPATALNRLCPATAFCRQRTTPANGCVRPVNCRGMSSANS